MKKILIKGYPYLVGECEFIQRQAFGLHPGDLVTIIGLPPDTSANRQDFFEPYVSYSGLIELDDDLFMAFQLPNSGVTGWDLFNPQAPVYKLYIPLFDYNEMICPNLPGQTIRIFKAKFNRYSGQRYS